MIRDWSWLPAAVKVKVTATAARCNPCFAVWRWIASVTWGSSCAWCVPAKIIRQFLAIQCEIAWVLAPSGFFGKLDSDGESHIAWNTSIFFKMEKPFVQHYSTHARSSSCKFSNWPTFPLWLMSLFPPSLSVARNFNAWIKILCYKTWSSQWFCRNDQWCMCSSPAHIRQMHSSLPMPIHHDYIP